MSARTDPLRIARRRAGLVLSVEQGWPALLLPAFLLGLFALLSLLTLPQRLPDWLHAVLVVALVVAVAGLARRGLQRLPTPTVEARDRRIERASRLQHRPLSTLADRPVVAAGAVALWDAHLSRTRAGLGVLGAGRPALRWRAHDPNHVGTVLAAALLLALLLSGREAPLRLASGFWPGIALPLGPRPTLQAWITPPIYAGGAPVFLADPHGRYAVPAGSTLSLSLFGSDATPTVRGVPGRFAALSARSWSFTQVLPATPADGVAVRVREAGHALADWRIVATEAAPPLVSWTSSPGADNTVPWRLRLPWSAQQRYGVRALVAEIRLADAPGKRVLRVPIPLSGTPEKAHGVALDDLSADPWAGAKVVARLVGTDGSGRSGHSADAAFVLPARPFRNPLARAVLDVRRRLATGAEPPDGAADDLAALGDTPGQLAQDSGLFLNLSAVVSLLRQSTDDADGAPRSGIDAAGRAAIGESTDRLWSLALALEDGLHNDRAGARASAEIRRAQDRVSAQIQHMRQLGAAGQTDAERDELSKRLAELKQAIARKMQALAAEAARNHTMLPTLPDVMTGGGDALGRMLKQMQDQAAAGHGDEAMQNLSRMQQMLDTMRLATPQDLRSAAEQAQATAQARDQMQAVQDLVQRQTGLLDSTQNRQGVADRARRDAEQRLQTDGEDAQNGTDGADTGAAPDAATRALLQQLGIPLDGDTGGQQGAPGRPAPTPPSQGPAAPAPGQSGADADAARGRDTHAQSVLSRALGELSQEFTALTGKKADSLADAEKNMQQARDALGDKRDGDAAAAQARALAALQKGRNQMSAAMRGGRSGGSGLALIPGSGQGSNYGADDAPDGDNSAQAGEDGNGEPGDEAELGSETKGPRDPLGRPTGDGNGVNGDGSETHLPTGDQAARSRQIENELRRRDSDRTRPQPELDYLDRLLKAF